MLQVFEDLQKMLTVSDNNLQSSMTQSKPVKASTLHTSENIYTSSLLRMVLGLFVALATVSVGMYALWKETQEILWNEVLLLRFEIFALVL